MIFTTLIWFRSVYKISSCCWFCIQIWIKWELWKIFDTKNELSLVTMWYPNKDKVFLNEYIRKCILSAQLVLSSQHTYLCKTLISHSNPFKHEITQPNMKLMINDLNDQAQGFKHQCFLYYMTLKWLRQWGWWLLPFLGNDLFLLK